MPSRRTRPQEPIKLPNVGETPAGAVTPWKTAAPRSPGVKNGLPRAMSKARNQTATTTAPIKPATTPSLRIERSADAISVRIIVCLPPSLGVPRESHAVVGVAQVGRQGGAVTDRAPRVGVPPGSATADAAGS